MSEETEKKFIFEDLDVYQQSLLFSKEVFEFTWKWPREYLFDLTSQLRRAALSIALNIAEGSAKSRKDFGRFLDISRGSCFECVPLIDIASKEGLIGLPSREFYLDKLVVLSKMLNRLRASLNN